MAAIDRPAARTTPTPLRPPRLSRRPASRVTISAMLMTRPPPPWPSRPPSPIRPAANATITYARAVRPPLLRPPVLMSPFTISELPQPWPELHPRVRPPFIISSAPSLDLLHFQSSELPSPPPLTCSLRPELSRCSTKPQLLDPVVSFLAPTTSCPDPSNPDSPPTMPRPRRHNSTLSDSPTTSTNPNSTASVPKDQQPRSIRPISDFLGHPKPLGLRPPEQPPLPLSDPSPQPLLDVEVWLLPRQRPILPLHYVEPELPYSVPSTIPGVRRSRFTESHPSLTYSNLVPR